MLTFFSLLVEIKEVAVVWTGQSASPGTVCAKPHIHPLLCRDCQQEKVVQRPGRLDVSHIPGHVVPLVMIESNTM